MSTDTGIQAAADAARPAGRRGMQPAERLAALGFLLGAGLAGAAFLAPLDGDPSPPPAAALAARPATTAASPYLAALPFDPARRPAVAGDALPAEPGPPPVAAQPAVAPVVAGVLVGGARRKVMFTGSDAGWQEVGSRFGGWTVAAVDPGGVVLERGAERLLLRPRDALAAR